MKTLAVAALLLFTSLSSFAAKPVVPRPAREIAVLEASGKQTLLSSYRGKAVILAFMFSDCPHCQTLSRLLTKLQMEYGPRGFQALGIIFNDATAAKAQAFAQQFRIGFPIGYAPRDTVISYLGISVMDRLTVPQTVIIDQKGTVIAQSEAAGSAQFSDEGYLRQMIEGMLKAPAPVSAATKKK